MKTIQSYVHISPDVDWVCFSTSSQFSLHSSDPGLGGGMAVEEAGLGGMRHIVPLHHSPLVLLVASGEKPGTSPRKLKVWNIQNKTILHEVTFKSSIEGLQWNKKYVAVLLDSELHVLDIQSMQTRLVLPTFTKLYTFAISTSMTSLHPISSNQSVTSSMSIHSLSGFAQAMNVQVTNHPSEHLLIYPTPDVAGCVDIYDLQDHKLIHKIQAHRSPLQLIAMNAHNNLLATSSKTGTIVRIFAIPSGEILFSYRISHLSVSIQQLVFCPHSDYLMVTTSSSLLSLCPLFTIKSRPASNAMNSSTTGESSGTNAMKLLQSFANQISTTASNVSQKSQDKEEAADISHLSLGEEDEDGFCAIEKHDEVQEVVEEDVTEDNEQSDEEDAHDDNVSVLTTPTVMTHQHQQLSSSAHSAHTSSSEQVPTTPSSSSPNVFNNFWSNITNTQTIFDASLNSIQKIRSYSQDIFSNGKANQANVHFEIDQEIRRPVMQATILANHEMSDGNSVVYALVYRPKKLTYYHAHGEDDEDGDDLQSAFGDTPHPVQMHTDEEELKLIMVTKAGLYRR